jgi:hypothetical protein
VFTDLGGHVAQQPDVSQDGSVFWRGLEVELNKPLKRATHLGFGELPRPLPEILPRGAGGNKSVLAPCDAFWQRLAQLAMLAAMRRASSRVSSLAAARCDVLVLLENRPKHAVHALRSHGIRR